MKNQCGISLTCMFLVIGSFICADGCFVWSGYEKLGEPNQKAIIVFDQGVENLFLQVKYEGAINEFGWIVPLPSLPEVNKVTFSCFHMLNISSYLGTKLYLTPRDIYMEMASDKYDGMQGGKQDVKVEKEIEVSDYSISVLNADDGMAMTQWLTANKFNIPDGGQAVIDDYILRKWHFVAIKVKPASQTREKEILLRKGELPPLHFIFKTSQPVYPLYISSLNSGSTRVQLYLFARELFIHNIFMPERNELKGYGDVFNPSAPKAKDSWRYDDYPVAFYRGFMLPALRYEIPRFTNGEWYCSKFDKTFQCESIKEDVLFEADAESIREAIRIIRDFELENGFDFSGEMFKLLTDLVGSLPTSSLRAYALNSLLVQYGIRPASGENSPESLVASMKEYFKQSFKIPPNAKEYYDKELFDAEVKVLTEKSYIENATLLATRQWFKDRKMTDKFYYFLWGKGLLDKYRQLELDNLQRAAFARFDNAKLDYPFDRDILDSWLSYPCKGIFANGSYYYHISHPLVDKSDNLANDPYNRRFRIHVGYGYSDEFRKYQKEKMGNSCWEEENKHDPCSLPPAEMQKQALSLLLRYRDPIAFEYLNSWLYHSQPSVRQSALSIMLASLDNHISSSGGLIPHVCESAYDEKQRNLRYVLHTLEDKDPGCRLAGAWIVALLGDTKNLQFFQRTAIETAWDNTDDSASYLAGTTLDNSADKPKWQKKFFQVSMAALTNNKCHESLATLSDILKRHQDRETKLIDTEWLLFAASAHMDHPEFQTLVFETLPEEVIVMSRALQDILPRYLVWLEETAGNIPSPKRRLWQEYCRNRLGMVGKQEFDSILDQILDDAKIKPSEIRTFIERCSEYKYFPSLIIYFQKHLDELLKDKANFFWVYDNLTGFIYTHQPDNRIEMIKNILDKNVSLKEMVLPHGFAPEDIQHNMLETVVLAGISSPENIDSHKNKFPEGHPDFEFCRRLLRTLEEGDPDYDEMDTLISEFFSTSDSHEFDKWTWFYFAYRFPDKFGLNNEFERNAKHREKVKALLIEEDILSPAYPLLFVLIAPDEELVKRICRELMRSSNDSRSRKYLDEKCRRSLRVFDRVRSELTKNPENFKLANDYFYVLRQSPRLMHVVYGRLLAKDHLYGDDKWLLSRIKTEITNRPQHDDDM